jgi:chromosome condensin MukBEF ATPase and DNA-binding subunit MukB
MSDEPANLVLLTLRGIEIKLDRLGDDVADMKIRLTNTEEGVAGVNRRLDRADARLDRIERRLELREAVEP